MKSKVHTRSLSQSLILKLSLAIGIVSIIACILFVLRIAKDERLKLENEAEQTITHLAGIMEKPLWNFDIQTMTFIGETFDKNNRISSLTFWGEDGEKLYSFQHADANSGVKRHAFVWHDGKKIGEIEMAFSIKYYYSLLWQIIQSTCLTIALILLIVFFTMNYLVKKQLRIPLNQFSQLVNSYAAGDYSCAPVGVSFSEFQPFKTVLITMGKQIHEQLLQLTTLNGILATKNKSLEAIEKELRENESKQRAMIANISDVIAIIDKAMINRYMSPNVARWFGWNHGDLLGVSIMENVHSNDLQRVKEVFSDLLERPNFTATLEFQYRCKDASYKWIEMTCVNLLHLPEIKGILVNYQDIAARKQAEEEKIILGSQLLQAQKMESVGGMAAGIAHEINNPLGIITQAVHNIEQRALGELPANQRVADSLQLNMNSLREYLRQREIPRFIRDIQEASLRASKIVSNMLQFSRKSESTLKPTSLTDLVEHVVSLASSDYELKKRYDFKGVEVRREFEKEMPLICVVAVEIEQVLFNLLQNAVHAMRENAHERKPTITFRVYIKERYAVIEVEDSGPGVPPEVRDRIFEPFFTTKKVGIGTGLGLSVSYGIITKNHQGQIHLHSSPGHGAKFVIQLPFA